MESINPFNSLNPFVARNKDIVTYFSILIKGKDRAYLIKITKLLEYKLKEL